MSEIVVCTGGEVKAYVQVELTNRIEAFQTQSPPVTIDPKELIIPFRGSREVRTFTTHNYGDLGRAMQTTTIYLPIRRILPRTSTFHGNTITHWDVEDSLGNMSQLVSQQVHSARWQWGSPLRYTLGPLLRGIPPEKRYSLEIRDSAGQERVWGPSLAPIPWEHWCGCKPGFKQCGDFPRNFCCADCAAINSGVNRAESSLQSATARIETLIQQIERYSLK